jgi:hypothetical protein
MVAGLPLMVYLGIITFILLIVTASIQIFNRRGLTHIPVMYHIWMARATILVAFIHALLVASTLIKF